jgi:tape measure domain-containing protein
MAANICEYILNLKDNISAKLKIIGINNEEQLNVWSNVERKVYSANNAMDKCGRSIATMSAKVEALKTQKEWIPASNKEAIRETNHEIQKLEKEINKLNNLDGGKLKKWFGEIKNSIPGFVNPITAAVVGVSKTIQIGMSSELQKTNLKTLFKNDEQAANEFYNRITKYAIKTPYEKKDLIEGQKTMMSFGVSAEKSFKTLQQIGDISMGDSQKMQSLTLAFSQATSAGKLQGQDLLQMINAGFNPLQVISERTGESMSSLRDKMSKGQISAKMLSQAFQWATDKQGLFYQGADKASETLNGKWSNLMDTLQEMAINFYDNVLNPILKPLLNFVQNAIDKIVWFFGELKRGNPVIVTITSIIGALTAAILICTSIVRIQTFAIKTWTIITTAAKIATQGWAFVQRLFNLTILASPITWIILGIVALIAVIIFCAVKIKGWGSLWHGVINGMKYIMLAFVDMIKLKWEILINGLMIGIDKIKVGWYKFKEAVGLGDSGENNAAISQINKDIEARKKAITDGAKKVVDDAKKAKDSFASINMSWDKSKSLSDVVESTKKKIGLGTNETLQDTVNGDGTQKGSKDKKGGKLKEDSSNAITSGGTRNTSINISIKDLVGNMTFEGGFDSNKQDIEDKVAEAMFRVLDIAQSSVN